MAHPNHRDEPNIINLLRSLLGGEEGFVRERGADLARGVDEPPRGPERNVNVGTDRFPKILNVRADDPRTDEEIRADFFARSRKESVSRRRKAGVQQTTAEEDNAAKLKEIIDNFADSPEEALTLFDQATLDLREREEDRRLQESADRTRLEEESLEQRRIEFASTETFRREQDRRDADAVLFEQEATQRRQRAANRDSFFQLASTLTPRDRITQSASLGRAVAGLGGDSSIQQILAAFGSSKGIVSSVAENLLSSFGGGFAEAASRGIEDAPSLNSEFDRFLAATGQTASDFINTAQAGGIPGTELTPELAGLIPGEVGGAIPLDFDTKFRPDIQGALRRGTISRADAQNLTDILSTQGDIDDLTVGPQRRARSFTSGSFSTIAGRR